MSALIPNDTYKQIMEAVPLCTVDVLFFNPDYSRILLFKRENAPLKGEYFSIGGRLHKNESFETCAARQAAKEAGITLRNGLTWGGAINEVHPDSVFDGVSYHSVNIFYGYIVTNEHECLILDPQHSGYKWFSTSDQNLHPFMKKKISALLHIYGQKL